MAYGHYRSVTVTVKTVDGNTYVFHVDPLLDPSSGGSGSIGVKERAVTGV